MGKSTTIHFLCGSTMVYKKDGDLTHITFDKINPKISESDRKILEKVETSAKAVSCTQFIKAINIDVDGNNLLLVDSPGLEDTRGVELDLANIYGIVKAAHVCESITPLILLSEKAMGERMAGLKRISKNLASMFNNVDNHLSSFVFMFNKFILRETPDKTL